MKQNNSIKGAGCLGVLVYCLFGFGVYHLIDSVDHYREKWKKQAAARKAVERQERRDAEAIEKTRRNLERTEERRAAQLRSNQDNFPDLRLSRRETQTETTTTTTTPAPK